MKQLDIKKLLLQNFPYVFLFWFFDRVGEGWRLATGADVVEKAMGMVSGLGQLITRNPLPSFHPQDLLVGLFGAGPSGWRCTSRPRTPRSTAEA